MGALPNSIVTGTSGSWAPTTCPPRRDVGSDGSARAKAGRGQPGSRGPLRGGPPAARRPPAFSTPKIPVAVWSLPRCGYYFIVELPLAGARHRGAARGAGALPGPAATEPD